MLKMKKNETFNALSKKNLPAGKELSDSGLVWRKLQEGTGVWRIDWSYKGHRYKEIIGKERHGITLTIARERFAQLRSRVVLGLQETKPKAHKLRFSTLLDDYLAGPSKLLLSHSHNMNRAEKYLRPKLGDLTLEKLTPSFLTTWLAELQGQGLSGSTVRKILYLTSAVYGHAAKTDSKITNPCSLASLPRKDTKPIVFFTETEIDSLIKACGFNLNHQAAIALGRYAGLRQSEVLGLEWAAIDLNEKRISVHQSMVVGKVRNNTKSGKIRIIPMSEKLHDILSRHGKVNGMEGAVIKTSKGVPYHKISEFWNRIKCKSGIKSKGTYHSLRHSFGTYCIAGNVDPRTLQSWMGHSNIETTMIYVHLQEQLPASAKAYLENN